MVMAMMVDTDRYLGLTLHWKLIYLAEYICFYLNTLPVELCRALR